MKVLAINGSPHAQGTTATAIGLIAQELNRQDIQVETVQIGHLALHGCTGCGGCRKPGAAGCVFADDPVNALVAKMREADGLILASPVYYGSIAGTMKCFLDRFFYSGGPFRFKAALSVACLRRTGGIATFHQLSNYLTLGQMVQVPTHYWNVAHGNGSGEELMQDGEGAQVLECLGRNMAWLMRCLAAGRAAEPLPEAPARVRTNFIR